MRYWLLTTEVPPHPGGIATYVAHACGALAAAGAEVTVFVQDAAQAQPSIESGWNGCRLVRFPAADDAARRSHPDWGRWGAAARAKRYHDMVRLFAGREGAPEVIEVQDYEGIGYYLMLHRHCDLDAAQPRMVAVCHNPLFNILSHDERSPHEVGHQIVRQMEMFCLAAADVVIFPSRFIRDQLAVHCGPETEVVVLPHPAVVDPEAQDWPALARRLVYIGRIQALKGVFELLELMQDLWEGGLTVELHIFGADTNDPTTGQSLRRQILRAYAPAIRERLLHLHGGYEARDLPRLLANGEFVILPGRHESFSYTCVEAVAHGRLPILVDGTAPAELVPEDLRPALTFRAGDADSLAAVLRGLMALSEEEVQDMRTRLRRHVADLCAVQTHARAKLDHARGGAPARRGFPAAGTQALVPAAAGETGPVEVVHLTDDAAGMPAGAVVAARAAALESAGPPYVCLSENGFAGEPDFLRQAAELLDAYPNLAVVGGWLRDAATGTVLGQWVPELPWPLVTDCLRLPGAVVRRSALRQVGGLAPRLGACATRDLFLRLRKAGYLAVVLPRVCGTVRAAGCSAAASPAARMHLERLVTAHASCFHEHLLDVVGLGADGLPSGGIGNAPWEVTKSPYSVY